MLLSVGLTFRNLGGLFHSGFQRVLKHNALGLVQFNDVYIVEMQFPSAVEGICD